MKKHKREVLIGAAVVCALMGCILLVLCSPRTPDNAHAAQISEPDAAAVSASQAAASEDMTRRMEEIYDYLVELDGMVTDNQTTLENVVTRSDHELTKEESVSVVREKIQTDVTDLGTRIDTLHKEITDTKKLIEDVNKAVEGGTTLSGEKSKASFTEISKSIENIDKELNSYQTEIKKLISTVNTDSSSENKAVTDALNQIKNSLEKNQSKSLSSVKTELEDIRRDYHAQLDSIQSSLNGSFRDISSAVGKLDAGVAGMSGSVEKVGQSVSAVSGSVSDIGRGVDSVSGKVSDIGKGVDSVSGKVSDLGKNIDGVSGNMKNIDDGMTEIKDGVARSGEEIGNIGGNVTRVRQDVADVDINVKKVGQDVTGLGSNMNKALEDVAAVGGNVNKAIADVALVGDSVNRVGESINSVSGNVDKLGTDVGNLAGSLTQVGENLGSQVENVGISVSSLDSKTENLKNQVSDVRDGLSQQMNDMNSSVAGRLDGIEAGMNRLFQFVSNGKQKLAAALLTKNVTLDPTSGWDQFRAAIESIQQVYYINGEEVPANAVYEYHKHSTDPADMISWSVEGPDDLSTNPAEIDNRTAVPASYCTGCFTEPILHVHDDECPRRVTETHAEITTQNWDCVNDHGRCIICNNAGSLYVYSCEYAVKTTVSHPNRDPVVTIDDVRTRTIGLTNVGGRTGYQCENCINSEMRAVLSTYEDIKSVVDCPLDGKATGYREACPYVKGQVVRAHLSFPGSD